MANHPPSPGQPRARCPHPISVMIGVLLLGAVLLWMLAAGGDVAAYASLPSAIFLVLTLLGALMMTFGPIALVIAMGDALGIFRTHDAHRLAQDEAVLGFASRMSWGAGVVGTVIVIVAIAKNLDWSQVAYAVATVATPPLLYGSALAVFVFTPLRQLARLRAASLQTAESVNDSE